MKMTLVENLRQQTLSRRDAEAESFLLNQPDTLTYDQRELMRQAFIAGAMKFSYIVLEIIQEEGKLT